MKIGIVGLGLIGGSYAKAIKEKTNWEVFGSDTDEATVWQALEQNAVDGILDASLLSECEIVILALYPAAILSYAKKMSAYFSKSCLVMDAGGVKGAVCAPLARLSKQAGFSFLGAHPMAGREFSGFSYAKGNLFQGASIVLTPQSEFPSHLLAKAEAFYRALGFTRVEITTPEHHDRMIAFTSQLAHVVASSYIKSPAAKNHVGFSAGSYRDLTRVARLNPDMWTRLFLDNRQNLSEEIEILISHLSEFKQALDAQDAEALHKLLEEGAQLKEEIDPVTRRNK